MEDGTFMAMEITKTVIERDGSRSVTRSVPRAASLSIQPNQYASSGINLGN